MDMHRTKGRPDWADVPAQQRNFYQQLAAATHGIVTPSNIVSVIGFGLVAYGLVLVLQQDYVLGLVFLAIGRLCDVADGWLAQATQTKSPLGELLDATIDKITSLLTLLVLYISGVAPPWILIVLLAPHFIIMVLTLRARLSGQAIHPSLLGKRCMFTAWVSLIGFLVLAAFPELAAINWLIYGVALLSAVLGLAAAVGYARGREYVPRLPGRRR